MKLVYTTGCMYDGVTVDKKDIAEIPFTEQKSIIKKVIDSIKEEDSMYCTLILRDLIELMGEYNFLYHCDQCGDDVSEHKLII